MHLSRCREWRNARLVAYVDDLLLCCQSENGEKIVEKAIGKAVPLKETGIILPARTSWRWTFNFHWQACASWN